MVLDTLWVKFESIPMAVKSQILFSKFVDKLVSYDLAGQIVKSRRGLIRMNCHVGEGGSQVGFDNLG